VKIWKLLLAILITVGLLLVVPYGFAQIALIHPLNAHAWLILSVTIVGLIAKMLFGDIASGEFSWHKHGYDFCIMTLGAVLSGLSLQLISDTDLFPGLSSIGLFSTFSQDVLGQRRIALFIFLISSFASALLTARISRAIGDPNTHLKAALSLLNFSIGTVFLAFYVLVLVTKS
jgi:hypothetical protein